MKKLFKIILCIAILMLNYTSLLTINVKAEGGYSFVIVYSDDTVTVAENLSYSEALTKMNEYESTEMAVAAIKDSTGKIVNAAYAIAELDYENGARRSSGDGDINMCGSPEQAASCNRESSTYINYFASTWGVDSALLDYNETYNAYKVKISGTVGWFSGQYVNISPISIFYGTKNTNFYSNNYPRIKTNVSGLNLRAEPTISSESLDSLGENETYIYYPSKSTTVADGCTWYYISKDDKKGYVCDKDNYLTIINKMLNDTYYYSYNNVLKMRVHKGSAKADVDFDVGTAPFYYDSTGKHFSLKLSSSTSTNADVRYYSFDGNYFYDKYSTMIDDYKAGVYTHAINASTPYYPYFVYLPAHSISGYTKEAIDGFVTNGTGITAFPDNPKSYVNFETQTWVTVPPANLSMMYGIGEKIIKAQKTYGVNALTIYGAAKSESGSGRSLIAFGKNNLFGMGAYDENPFAYATSYDTIQDSINAYAASISVTTFGNIYAWQYSGTHLGNKKNGQQSSYASDPYSGYSKASTPYYLDKNYGGLDEFASTLGITTNTTSAVKIYKEPSTSSGVIYETRNYSTNKILSNIPFIVLEKVTVKENNNDVIYYKVMSDLPLDSNRNLASGSTYMTEYSYGYIKESDLYVQNTAPTLTVSDKEVEQYDNFDPLDIATATDFEDNIDGKKVSVTYEGTFNINKAGTYNLTYIATDSSNYSVKENATIVVKPNQKPEITATNKTVYLDDEFNYLDGITASDNEDGDVTSTLTYTGTVDTSTVGEYQITYSAKDNDNQETTKTITINVEEKQFIAKDGRFYLHNLTYDEDTKLVNITGYLAIRGINNTLNDEIKYDIIFENQYNGETIVKSLNRLTKDYPFNITGENGYDYTGAWFNKSITLADLPSADYTVYVRARLGDYESKVLLKNEYFSTNVVRKFSDDTKGYQFRINYYNRNLPLELFVRDSSLLSTTDTPTIDNMYNQVYSIDVDSNGILKLKASSHNVNGDYSENSNVERTISFVNVATVKTALTKNVGSITNGPYKVNLKVSDGKDKTRVWYETEQDLTILPKGTYSIVVRTKTGDIDDHGELYDVMFMDIAKTVEVNGKKISISRNEEKRYRIEITIE